MRVSSIARSIVMIVVFLVAMWGYFQATMPGYFKSISLCSGGCHTTRVLKYTNITHPFWCIGCHGFGVKSNIVPWLNIPLYRDVKLEHMVEEYGECLMCHPIPGEFHLKHLEAKPKELAKVGLTRPIECTDCHVNAYHGHHTDRPRDKVCIKCHDAAKIHGDMVKSIRAACTACHSEKPVIPASLLAPNKTSYSNVVVLAGILYDRLGIRYTPPNGCLACHSKPETIGHIKHLNATWHRRSVTCTDCHLGIEAHGWKPSTDVCIDCHRFNQTRLHDYPKLLSNCYRCHRGFRLANTSLVPVKTCRGCHGSTLVEATSTGLHLAHLRVYGWRCSICHNTTLPTHKLLIESARNVTICKRCHDYYGALKKEALKGLAPGAALYAGAGVFHEYLVEKAKGDCFKCHYEWFLLTKPSLVYVYPARR